MTVSGKTYAIQPASGGLVKIGKSDNPQKRLAWVRNRFRRHLMSAVA
jgi:hypothetical protein